MSILDKIKKILPKRKEPELKNNVPKEKENIRKTFAAYCNANHGTEGGKLCPKCTALLTQVMLKIQRCPYGIGKPLCDLCETSCLGEDVTKNFRETMQGGRKKMRLSHPLQVVRHKLASMGMEYAKIQRDKKSTDKQKEQESKCVTKLHRLHAHRKNPSARKKSNCQKMEE